MKKQTVILTIAIVFVCVIGAGAGVVYASDDAVPGDFLYPVDRAMENLQLALNQDPAEEAELEMEFLEERAHELDQLLQLSVQGDDDEDEELEENIDESLDELLEGAGNAYGRTAEMIQARIEGNVSEVVHQRVLLKQKENAERHIEKFEQVIEKVEEKTSGKGKSNAAQKMEKALENFKRAKQQALNALEDGENGDTGYGL